jgi:DHA1 family tetracycline resistance protein-like MFS transporter
MGPTLARLLPLYVVIFVGFLGYSLMITVFTPMIMHVDGDFVAETTPTGTRTIILGILLALYPLGQLVSAPAIGTLSDRFGRKPVLLITLILAVAVYFLLVRALEHQSLFLLMLACLLGGLSEGNVTIGQSAIADLTTSEERGRFFGYVFVVISFAYVVGPLLGGRLADPSMVSWFDDATPFWCVFGLLTMTAAWVAFDFVETRAAEASSKIRLFDAATNLLNIVTDQRLRMLYLINFCLYLAVFGFFRSYPMYLVDEFGMDVTGLSDFVAWVAVPVILVNLFAIGWLLRGFAIERLMFWSAVLFAVAMVVVVIPPSANALWLTLPFAGLFLAVCLPTCSAVLSLAVGKDEQGRVLGNNQSLQFGAESFSGLVAGFLAAAFVPLPLIVLAVVALIGAGLLKLHQHQTDRLAARSEITPGG